MKAIKLWAGLVMVVTLVTGFGWVSAARATGPIASECPYGDARTPSQKLPRPGVVLVSFSPYSGFWFEPKTIAADGHLSSILLDNYSEDDPIVSVWQNRTSCYGSEISRNAWAVTPAGRLYTENGYSGPPTANFGDMYGRSLNKPIVGMSPTADGLGYWFVASDGGIFAFGDATFLGSTGNITLNKPIVGMAVTPSGQGYYLVASDGGIFAFGDAQFYGSTGNIVLNKPIVGMTVTPSGHGYWMTASDGGIFAFGDADFHGSTGDRILAAPIGGMIPNGTGYTLIGRDGTIYPFQ
ncbi:MAG: hypothetical protein U0V73_07240 [Acidimicrobiia bacterium]